MRSFLLAVSLLAAPAAPPAALRLLGLDEAIRIARENQPQLRQARAGTEAAQARADEARSALLPQLTGTAGYARATSNLPGLPESSASANLWALRATLNQLVWDFGQTSGRYQAAREGAASQEASERATRLQVIFSVRSAFFTARAARDLVGVARETLQNQEAHLRQVQGFVEVGRSPEIDLAQVRTDRANAEVQLIRAQNDYETAKAQLNQAMGVEGSTDYEVADDTLPAVEGEDLPIEPLLAEALPRRPDVAALEAEVRAQRATLDSAKGGYWPSLGLVAGASDVGPELSGPGMAWNWSAGATLTWNLFQGGLTSAQVREARANLTALDAQLASLQQQVRLDLEQARLPVRAAKAALSAAAEALVNARERLRLAEGRYQTGAGSIIELGDAQVALTSAAAQKVQADFALSAARALLLRALGRPAPGEEAAGHPQRGS
ncbi:MAG TPA: TolC family protein [Anaeromyxobacteraceae bacterium]|nr:TolC family protein [Anaeromyxobacteraceae bacterium]